MIQRIQSFWLFISSLLNGGLLLFDFYKLPPSAGVNYSVGVTNHYPSLLLTVVAILIPIIAIFRFKNRKQQIRLCIVSMVANLSLISMLLQRTSITLKLPLNIYGNYWIGSVLLPLSILCLIPAIMGIRKDEKLVKSTDRLR